MWDSKLFKTGVGILLLFLIIYVGTHISFIFYPLVVAFEALFISFFAAGILYYFTYPLVDRMHNRKVPRSLAIIIVFLFIIGLLVLLYMIIAPVLIKEFSKLAESIPRGIMEIRSLIRDLEEMDLAAAIIDLEALDIDNIVDELARTANRFITQIATSFAYIVDFITEVFLTIIIVPFLLYYMLKEKGSQFFPRLVEQLSPEGYVSTIKNTLAEINKMLGIYFQGLGIVCVFVGILAYIGFLIIGLDYALLLSIFIMITNVVPFLGPFIGSIPAVVVGLLDSPLTMLLVIIIIVIVQQIESMVVSPQVMGRRLSLSPLAIILIVLVAGRLGGLAGIILAIPTFTVLKIIIAHTYQFYKLGKTEG
ncbi:MAG: AI-2E family transporter [Bacillota bacterium]